jgi:hypothetical protein
MSIVSAAHLLLAFDGIHLPLESLLLDALEDNVASLVGLQESISDDIGGFGLAELFVESRVSHSLEHSRLEASVFDLHDGVDELNLRWPTPPCMSLQRRSLLPSFNRGYEGHSSCSGGSYRRQAQCLLVIGVSSIASAYPCYAGT